MFALQRVMLWEVWNLGDCGQAVGNGTQWVDFEGDVQL